MLTDSIADYLTRIRNAGKAKHKVVEIPSSKLKKEITKVLFEKGYISKYKIEDNVVQDKIKIALKYDPNTKLPVIRKLLRISKPGLRKYCDSRSLPRVLNGLGIAILSTSRGIMTDKEAAKNKLGGEVLCYVY